MNGLALRAPVLAGFLFFAVNGCGGMRGEQRPDLLRSRFAEAQARRARELAPDLYARAVRAWLDARRAHGDPKAEADHQTRARLLLEAAEAEAARIALERATSAAEASITRATEQRAELERARLELEQATRREQAARCSAAQAERAFQEVELEPDTSRGAPAQRNGTRARAAEVVRQRALLTLAAAMALGLSRERNEELERTIASAEHARSGTALLEAARAALNKAERALGDARKSRGGPTREQTAALLALAQERGLHPTLSPRGLLVPLDAMFVATSARPTSSGRRRLEQMAALARAHPAGPIQIEALAAPSSSTTRQALARARAGRIETALAAATDPSRLRLAHAPVDEQGVERPQLMFPAYVLEPESNTAAQPAERGATVESARRKQGDDSCWTRRGISPRLHARSELRPTEPSSRFHLDLL